MPVKKTPRYAVPVTNEFFHYGNVEAWKNIIDHYHEKHPGSKIHVFHRNRPVPRISKLFKWGKVSVGDVIQFSVTGPEFKDVAKLKKYLTMGASPRFHPFIKKHQYDTLNLFSQVQYPTDNNRLKTAPNAAVKNNFKERLKLLSDMYRRGELSKADFIRSVSVAELNTLFQPVVDRNSTRELVPIAGGREGAFGAGCGRVFFSAEGLIEAFRQAETNNLETDFILLRETTHAEDLEAIGLSRGVITSEGGYTSHAPIVARHLGIPAIIHPEIKIATDIVTIGERIIREGQYLTLEVPSNQTPMLYIGKALIRAPELINEDLSSLLELAEKQCSGTRVRANADTTEEAELALLYKADGIGLCRTEHMLRDSEALADLQSLLIGGQQEPAQALERLERFYETRFLELFRLLAGKPLTIRLLDAPPNEFIPRSDSMRNPMTGLRGGRLGLSMPALYEMQVRAVVNAALQAHDEGIAVKPEILVPFLISSKELKILRRGHTEEGQHIPGIDTVIREAATSAGLDQLPFRPGIGVVIELPAAAVSADELVQQAEIISFGTNDLTQSTLGVSRDDLGAMLRLYEELDIWEGDPFQDLVEPVRRQIESAVVAARTVRPDVQTGICGEAGASPESIAFAVRMGLDFISCPPRTVPAVLLTAAQLQLEGDSEINPR